jgi:hypothetical protein
MRNKINIGGIATLTLLTIVFTGCSFSVGTNTNSSTTANTAKPANTTANSNAASSNSNAASNTAAAPKKDEKLVGDKKHEGKTSKPKEVPVPADWITISNEKRGFQFTVPAGTTGHQDSSNGTDVYMATTPSGVQVLVFAFKDAKMTKEDLLKTAEQALANLGQTIQAGKLTNESDDYSIAEATMTGKDGVKSKVKVLVATDVTDNFVMVVGTEEAKYAANEKIIDEIWGNFEMWSGGASGTN